MLKYVVLGEDREGKVITEYIDAVCERAARDQFTRRHIGKNLKIKQVFEKDDIASIIQKGGLVQIISPKRISHGDLIEIKTEYLGAIGFIKKVDLSNKCPFEIEFIGVYSYLNKQTGFTWSSEHIRVI